MKSKPKLPFLLSQFIDHFITTNCAAWSTDDFDNVHHPFIESEIRIVLHERGDGYIHVIGRDSETINFHLDSIEAKRFHRPPPKPKVEPQPEKAQEEQSELIAIEFKNWFDEKVRHSFTYEGSKSKYLGKSDNELFKIFLETRKHHD